MRSLSLEETQMSERNELPIRCCVIRVVLTLARNGHRITNYYSQSFPDKRLSVVLRPPC